MTPPIAGTLAITAAAVGALHSLAPDHWVPVAAVSRARGWSLGRTARVSLLCGFGHVTVSVALGLIALISGTAVVEALGARTGAIAGVLMIGFGAAYALWGARHVLVRKLHGHDHAHVDHVHDPSHAGVWTLFAIYCADPCVAVIPILFGAAMVSRAATIGIICIYEAATICTMVGLTVAARAGASLIRGRWVERYGDSAAGAVIFATGITVMVAGW